MHSTNRAHFTQCGRFLAEYQPLRLCALNSLQPSPSRCINIRPTAGPTRLPHPKAIPKCTHINQILPKDRWHRVQRRLLCGTCIDPKRIKRHARARCLGIWHFLFDYLHVITKTTLVRYFGCAECSLLDAKRTMGISYLTWLDLHVILYATNIAPVRSEVWSPSSYTALTVKLKQHADNEKKKKKNEKEKKKNFTLTNHPTEVPPTQTRNNQTQP